MFSHRGSKDCQERNSCLCIENSVVQPLLTDLYQITMAYAYWKSGKTNDVAAFDLFFRKNPFNGEFTIFAGLSDCLAFLENFHYSDTDVAYLKSVLPPTVEDEFFTFLQSLSPSEVEVTAIPEGSVTFPRVPLLRIRGPLITLQLLETTFLTLVNYASLMATNAARFRIAAGDNITLLEFGLRRAQGPDGGLSASRYAYVGGFDGTSNVLAGKLYGIPVKGTHAHAYVTSFGGLDELHTRILEKKTESNDKIDEEDEAPEEADGNENGEAEGKEETEENKEETPAENDDENKESGDTEAATTEGADDNLDFVDRCLRWRENLGADLNIMASEAHDGELAAFISYAIAFPNNLLALIDTYDVGRSGLLNFLAVAMALNDLGYKAMGIRIDSGDLAYLSKVIKDAFVRVSELYSMPWISELVITASNDINEETILSLNEQSHRINCFGIGTHLVTCQRQPALGCVYKLVEVNGKPTIKLSQDVHKITMPGRKNAYRLYTNDGHALIDLLTMPNEEPPSVGCRVLCRHPFEESKRAYVVPWRVEPLYRTVWEEGKIVMDIPSLADIRENVKASLKTLRQDHKRSLNPTPYKVGVSDALYHFIHDLWLENAPIGELS